VLGGDGDAFAAISLAMPVMRLEDEEQEARFIERLKQAAKDVLESLRTRVPANPR
jgi:DNA-binding IclR family transcriptional regulator